MDLQAQNNLMIALKNNDLSEIQRQLATGADANCRLMDVLPPLYFFAFHDQHTVATAYIVRALLAAGARPDDMITGPAPDDEPHSVAHYAASSGNGEMIKLLAAGGANLQLQNPSGHVALHYAADEATFLDCLAAGADPLIGSIDGRTNYVSPFDMAIKMRWTKAVEACLAHIPHGDPRKAATAALARMAIDDAEEAEEAHAWQSHGVVIPFKPRPALH